MGYFPDIGATKSAAPRPFRLAACLTISWPKPEWVFLAQRLLFAMKNAQAVKIHQDIIQT